MQTFKKIIRSFKSLIKNLSARIKSSWQLFTSFLSNTRTSLMSFFSRFWVWLQFSAKRILYTLRQFHNPVFYSITITIMIILFYVAYSPIIHDDKNTFMDDSTTVQNFIEWVGILYSLLVSMILVRSWERLENIGNMFTEEAYALLNLADSVRLISAKPVENLTSDVDKAVALIKDYVNHVEESYYIEYNNIIKELDGDKKVDLIGKQIEKITNENPDLINHNLIQKSNDVINARKNRLLNSKIRMPFSVYILLFISSVLWLGLFSSVDFKNSWLAYIIVGCLIFMVITITITILFFYNPRNINLNDISSFWKELKSRI